MADIHDRSKFRPSVDRIISGIWIYTKQKHKAYGNKSIKKNGIGVIINMKKRIIRNISKRNLLCMYRGKILRGDLTVSTRNRNRQDRSSQYLPYNRRMNKPVVADKEDAEILTILLPIRMALSILEVCFSVVSSTKAARRLPSSARERSRILLTVISAVSADEKNADSNNKITRIINWKVSLESNCVVHSFC